MVETPKEQQLYQKLTEKTLAGRLKWKMTAGDTDSYFIDFGEAGGWRKRMEMYHVAITRVNGTATYATMTMRLNDEYLTGYVGKDLELFHLAEASCKARQDVLREAIAALEAL